MGRRGKNHMITIESSLGNIGNKVTMAKSFVAKGGVIHSVRCRVYSLIENKDKFVGCKWDKLIK